MTTPILLDSSYLIALVNRKDDHHLEAREFAQADRSRYVIADVALTEVTYAVRKVLGKPAEIAFIHRYAQATYDLEPVTKHDLARVYAIMAQYTQFDFVDCCILALAERLAITRIGTFDRRDFGTFQPSHCPYLELLP